MGKRNNRTMLAKLRGFFWPHIGWRRAAKYLGHRIARLPGTPYSIAAGFACGAAVSFTPFFGLHFLFAALLALALRANVLASAFGTIVGNPWTFPLIYAAAHPLGQAILGRDGVASATVGDVMHDAKRVCGLVWDLVLVRLGWHDDPTLSAFTVKAQLAHTFHRAWDIALPWTVGGAPIGLLCSLVCFVIVYKLVILHRTRRLERRRARELRRAQRAQAAASA